jgi:hypothetical protein
VNGLAQAAVSFGTVIVVGALLVWAHDSLERVIQRAAADPRYRACKRASGGRGR